MLTLKPYPAMHTQFSRRTITAIALLLVAATVPYKAQAQSYPLAEARAAFWEASANAQELTRKGTYDAWAQAGGKCVGETETCREWAAKSREDAELYRAEAKDTRENPFHRTTNLAPGNTAQDEARIWRGYSRRSRRECSLYFGIQADQCLQ